MIEFKLNVSKVFFPNFWPLDAGIAHLWTEHRIPRPNLYIIPAETQNLVKTMTKIQSN